MSEEENKRVAFQDQGKHRLYSQQLLYVDRSRGQKRLRIVRDRDVEVQPREEVELKEVRSKKEAEP